MEILVLLIIPWYISIPTLLLVALIFWSMYEAQYIFYRVIREGEKWASPEEDKESPPAFPLLAIE